MDSSPVTTILVVDDELANTEVLTLILSEEGYRTFSAANGREGLERARELLPDLVVLDYMMPLVDGGEMARELRADPALRGIRILMNSSLSEDAVRERSCDYDAFIRKPYGVREMLRVITDLLATR